MACLFYFWGGVGMRWTCCRVCLYGCMCRHGAIDTLRLAYLHIDAAPPTAHAPHSQRLAVLIPRLGGRQRKEEEGQEEGEQQEQ